MQSRQSENNQVPFHRMACQCPGSGVGDLGCAGLGKGGRAGVHPYLSQVPLANGVSFEDSQILNPSSCVESLCSSLTMSLVFHLITLNPPYRNLNLTALHGHHPRRAGKQMAKWMAMQGNFQNNIHYVRVKKKSHFFLPPSKF